MRLVPRSGVKLSDTLGWAERPSGEAARGAPGPGRGARPSGVSEPSSPHLSVFQAQTREGRGCGDVRVATGKAGAALTGAGNQRGPELRALPGVPGAKPASARGSQQVSLWGSEENC